MNVEKFHAVWYMIKDSFIILAHHKKLLLYKLTLAALQAVGFAIPMIIANYWYGGQDVDLIYGLATSYPWLFSIGTLVIVAGITFIQFIIDVALSYHTMRIIYHEPGSFKNSLQAARSNIALILGWTLCWLGIDFAIAFFSAYIHHLLFMLINALLLIFVSFYIVPILANDTVTLLQAFKRSFNLSRASITMVLAGIIALFVPAKIIETMITRILNYSAIRPCVSYIGLGLLFVFLYLIMATVFIIYRTIAYYQQYQRHLEDAEIMHYPEF